jgi:hypothetical protein
MSQKSSVTQIASLVPQALTLGSDSPIQRIKRQSGNRNRARGVVERPPADAGALAHGVVRTLRSSWYS